jgi:hypothetical protein
MGKRSDFKRIDRDRYMTPRAAVLPLVRYLQRDGVETFADLCDGGGGIGLVHHLEDFGYHCVHRGDILTGQNALEVKRCVGDPDIGITNPPFKYPEDHDHSTRLLRDLIRHFLDLGLPFRLLLPHDFSTNEYAAPFLRSCSDIVAVGRVKWIPNSEFSGGKDNSCWYRSTPVTRAITPPSATTAANRSAGVNRERLHEENQTRIDARLSIRFRREHERQSSLLSST